MQTFFPEHELADRVYEVDIPPDALAVDAEEIERVLGYPRGRTPAHLRLMIDEVLSVLPDKCAVGAGYRIVGIRAEPGRRNGLYVGDVFFEVQEIVTGLLRKAEEAALFVCTIGPRMEEWSHQIHDEGNILKSFLIDTAASVAAECTANVLHDHIGLAMAQRGLKITNRYSPGYCNWSVAEQHRLFSLLPKGFCGIRLTESALMIPIKSISGIIGIGSSVKRVDYTCDTCGVKDCTYRSTRPKTSAKKPASARLRSR